MRECICYYLLFHFLFSSICYNLQHVSFSTSDSIFCLVPSTSTCNLYLFLPLISFFVQFHLLQLATCICFYLYSHFLFIVPSASICNVYLFLPLIPFFAQFLLLQLVAPRTWLREERPLHHLGTAGPVHPWHSMVR